MYTGTVFLAWLLTAVLKRSIFRYMQQTSCITRDHSWVSREISCNTRENSQVIPASSMKIHASLDALLRGKNEIFTQDTWKLDLSCKLYCTCISRALFISKLWRGSLIKKKCWFTAVDLQTTLFLLHFSILYAILHLIKADVARSDARAPGMRWLQIRSSRPATFFCGDWSWNNFYGHALLSADSRRAVVSYWWKNVQKVLVNCLEGLPRNSVDRLMTPPEMTRKVPKGRKTPTQHQKHKILMKYW